MEKYRLLLPLLLAALTMSTTSEVARVSGLLETLSSSFLRWWMGWMTGGRGQVMARIWKGEYGGMRGGSVLEGMVAAEIEVI